MNSVKPKKNIALKVVLILFFLSLTVLVGFYGYVQFRSYPAEVVALEKIITADNFAVSEERNVIIITPDFVDTSRPAIIFYPGGLVNPKAYLFKTAGLAECLGTTVYLVKPPFNASIFAINAAAVIINEHQLEKPWIGGHSLGGIAAARFTFKNPESVGGLFFLGSYSDQDLSHFQGPIISIMGLNDLIINRENYEAAKNNLPAGSVFLEQAGLNHSAFGNYGLQSGDGVSRLTDQEIIALLCSVFKQIN
jgi:hypothetical protein